MFNSPGITWDFLTSCQDPDPFKIHIARPTENFEYGIWNMEYGISNLDFEIYNFYKEANFRPPTVNNLGNQSELTEVWREKEDYSSYLDCLDFWSVLFCWFLSGPRAYTKYVKFDKNTNNSDTSLQVNKW